MSKTASKPHPEDKALAFHDLVIRTDRHEVYSNNQRIHLTKKEYELLEFLVRHKECTISKLTILEYVWDFRARAGSNTVEVHMGILRRKINSRCELKPIRTVHGLGYKFSDQPL